MDVTRLVLDAVTDARDAFPDHQWRLELSGDIVTLTGDTERLHQVLANLLSNAGMHTPPSTTVTTRLAVHSGDGEAGSKTGCRRGERDHDGPGIAPGQADELFDRFSRGDSSRSRAHGSTGLGLAIALGIATAHGGTLTMTDAEDGGARFVIRLPADHDLKTPQI